jgi:hypothetical protein
MPPPATGSGGSISGFLWNDADGDGTVDSDESRTGRRLVYLDQNRNAKLDSGEKSTYSDSNGNYAFSGLAAGTYYVTRQYPSGYQMSNNADGYITVSLLSNGSVSGVNLGTTSVSNQVVGSPAGTIDRVISGFLWNDDDLDGVPDAADGESRTGIRTVYLDQNRNGRLDSGEKSTKSDSQGNYRFSGLASGTYYVTRVFPSGYRLSNNNAGYVQAILGPSAVVNLGTRMV